VRRTAVAAAIGLFATAAICFRTRAPIGDSFGRPATHRHRATT
jgi:hypothetical protein